MRVLKDEQDPSQAVSVEVAATYVMNHLFNHTTMLLLGGYTISTAFSRCQLELRIASLLQRHLGNSPSLFILAIMFLGLFLSMWISNHTAPILCATIILPIVRDLPTDSRYSHRDASPIP
jgi:phosphate transporter